MGTQTPPNSEYDQSAVGAPSESGPALPPSREKTPGVYVRAGEHQPQELDMLWSGSRHFVKEDRSPIVFTVVGALVGAIITSALFFLFTSKPHVTAGGGAMTQPLTEAGSAPRLYEPITVSVSGPGSNQAAAQQNPASTRVLRQDALSPAGANVSVPQSGAGDSASTGGASAGASAYEVQSGDTLERIARRFYGSGAPDLVEKIQRANAMSSPDKLQIGQELTIPPKTY